MSTPAATPRPAIAHGTAYALAALSMVIWSSPPVVARAISSGVPPLAVSFVRWSVALLLLAPFVARKLRGEWPNLRTHWRSLALLAGFMTVGSTLSVLAVYYTTATNAVIVNASQPAVTAFFAWVLAGTRLTGPQKAGIACAFLGVVIMITRADLSSLLELKINVGDLIMLGAVTGWSIYAVQLHRREYLPSAEILLFIITLTGSLVLLPLYIVEASVRGPFELRVGVLGALVYLALFPTLLAVFTWNLALRSIGPNRAAIFVNLIPISGAALAMIFLGERLYFYHWLGAAVVFVGIYFAVRRA
ncbi:MAG TPA: DMT family transporter [Gammaproteobacteria bacterium]